MKLARCRAVLEGRDYVTPEDVKFVAVPALAHRLSLRPELWVQRIRAGGRRRRAARDRADPARRGRLAEHAMRRSAAPKLGAYAALAGLGLLAALVLGQPLLVRWRRRSPSSSRRADPRRRSRAAASVELDRERVLEGDEIVLELELWALRGIPRLDILVGCRNASSSRRATTRCRSGSSRASRSTLTLRLRASAGAPTSSATCSSAGRTRSASSATT